MTIPTPQAYVFYNGEEKGPERQVLRLSDSFENKEMKGCLEFECTVLNINYGKNRLIMEKCRSLMGYAILVHKIRHYEKENLSLAEAVDQAIQECIADGILEEYLRLNQSEVKELILSEYDEQKHIENEKKWSWEEGISLANELINLLLQDNRQDDMKRSLTDDAFRLKLMREYNLIKD